MRQLFTRSLAAFLLVTPSALSAQSMSSSGALAGLGTVAFVAFAVLMNLCGVLPCVMMWRRRRVREVKHFELKIIGAFALAAPVAAAGCFWGLVCLLDDTLLLSLLWFPAAAAVMFTYGLLCLWERPAPTWALDD